MKNGRKGAGPIILEKVPDVQDLNSPCLILVHIHNEISSIFTCQSVEEDV